MNISSKSTIYSLLFVLLAGTSQVAFAQINVSMPAGGEVFFHGDQTVINWYWVTPPPSHVTEVIVDLYRNGSLWDTNIASGSKYETYLPWEVPSNLSTSGSYHVRVRGVGGGGDGVSGTFTISDAYLEFDSGYDGSTVEVDQGFSFSWDHNMTEGSFVLKYNAGSGWETFDTINYTKTAHGWNPPNNLAGETVDIMISNPNYQGITDNINNLNLVDHYITVSSPSGGQEFRDGDPITINWSTHDFDSEHGVDILLFKDGSYDQELFSETDDDGSESWTVDVSTASAAGNSSFYIKVYELVAPDTQGPETGSSGTFDIVKNELSFTSDYGGQNVITGGDLDLNWSTNLNSGSIVVEYNNGSSWENIETTGYSTTGTTWNPSTSLTGSTDIRIRSTDYSHVTDQIDNINLVQGSLTFTTLGNQQLEAGQDFNINWNHNVDSGNLELHYWEGGAWQPLTTVSNAQSSYTWQPPASLDGQTTQIRIRSTAYPHLADTIEGLEVFAEPAGGYGEAIRVISYDDYDDFSNPLETTNAQGAVATYRWGANHTDLTGIAQGSDSDEMDFEDYEKAPFSWDRSQPNQSLSIQHAYSGEYSWQVASSLQSAEYMTAQSFYPSDLDLSKTYVFSAWVKAPATHDNINIQIKYKDGSGWNYPPGASYNGAGEWQLLETSLDLSQISGLIQINVVTRNHGSNGILCWWDDLRFYPEGAALTTATYDSLGLISTIQNPGGTTQRFSYDGFSRLDSLWNSANELVSSYHYEYAGSSFSTSNPNYIRITTFDGTGPDRVATEYMDGLGRSIQAHQQIGSDDIVVANSYDPQGRQHKTYKPYQQPNSLHSYRSNFEAEADSWYNNASPSRPGDNGYPYGQQQYELSPLNRPIKIIPAGGETAEGAATTDYAVRSWIQNGDTLNYQVTTTTDESGYVTETWSDGWGRTVRTVADPAGIAAETVFEYDVLGNLEKVTAPNGTETTYSYDSRGNLIQKTSADAGTVKYTYDAAGNLRYSQDANQASAGEVAFTRYDALGRPILSGVGSASFGGLDPDATESFENTQANWVTLTAYDAKPGTGSYPWDQFATELGAHTLSNSKGQVTARMHRFGGTGQAGDTGVSTVAGSNPWQLELYSYDSEGRLTDKWIYTGNQSAWITHLSYEYNRAGEVITQTTNVSSEELYHHYSYNQRGLLDSVFVSTDGVKPTTAEVVYSYTATGAIDNIDYKGSKDVDYGYTIRDWVASINDTGNPGGNFAADYIYTDNGNVETAQYHNPQVQSGGGSNAHSWDFGYDGLNRLDDADFGDNGPGSFDVAGLDYDLAGNITALQRRDETGSFIDNLTYSYSGSNRLQSVGDAVPTTTPDWDAEDASFTYDDNGNLTSQTGKLGDIAYEHRNLPVQFSLATNDTLIANYNADGQRILKELKGGAWQFYVMDGPQTLAVIDNTGFSHFNLLGNATFGRWEPGGTRRYYISDHPGSTRAVVDDAGNVLETFDYYPFGLLMPKRNTAGANTIEKFTGKERDEEGGLNLVYLGARYYDPAIGKLQSVDPLGGDYPGQGLYSYVMNNPTNLIDPTGMCPEDGSAGENQFGAGQCMEAITVIAKRPKEYDSNGYLLGSTFYFNSKTKRGRERLYSFIRSNPQSSNRIISSKRFSTSSKMIAMKASIHNAQATFLRISLETGADLASVAALMSGVGTVAGAGAFLIKRGSISVGKNYLTKAGAVELMKHSSSIGIRASGIETATRLAALPVGGSRDAATQALLRTAASGVLGGLPVLGIGVKATGLNTAAFRSASSGRFVRDYYGISVFTGTKLGSSATVGAGSFLYNQQNN